MRIDGSTSFHAAALVVVFGLVFGYENEASVAELPVAEDLGEASSAAICDEAQCPKTIFKHLKDRCEPIYGDSCCPLAFNCENYYSEVESPYCKYDGVLYKPGETVPVPCNACYCNEYQNVTNLICNPYDCPGFFRRPPGIPPCVSVSGGCCSDTVCGVEAAQILAEPKCTFGGKDYTSGSKFYPDECTSCTCSSSWTGKPDNTSCKPVDCKLELYKDQLDSDCGMVYIEDGCCPYSLCKNEILSITPVEKPLECLQPKHTGSGNSSENVFYYERTTNTCENFEYLGSDGNSNRFSNEEECVDKCTPGSNPCELPPSSGNCNQEEERYFYNKTSNRCERFSYSGCGGNENSFENIARCESQCQQPDSSAEMMCEWNGQNFTKGQKLLLKTRYRHPCVSVHCIAPPRLTFLHRKCPDIPGTEDCRRVYGDSCCPTIVCDKKPGSGDSAKTKDSKKNPSEDTLVEPPSPGIGGGLEPQPPGYFEETADPPVLVEGDVQDSGPLPPGPVGGEIPPDPLPQETADIQPPVIDLMEKIPEPTKPEKK